MQAERPFGIATFNHIASGIHDGELASGVNALGPHRALGEIMDVFKGQSSEGIANADDVALDVVGRARHVLLDRRQGRRVVLRRRRAVAGDCADRAPQRIDLNACWRVVMVRVAAVRLDAGMRTGRVVVGIVGEGLPRCRREFRTVQRRQRRIGQVERNAVDNELFRGIRVDGAHQLPARVVEHFHRLTLLCVAGLRVVPPNIEKGFELLDDAALFVIDLPTAHDDVGSVCAGVFNASDEAAGWAVLIRRQHGVAATEMRVTKAHSLALRAGLQEAAEAVGIFSGFDCFAGVVGVAVVKDAADRACVDGLWVVRVGESGIETGTQVVVDVNACHYSVACVGGVGVRCAGLAHGPGIGHQTRGRVLQAGDVAVGIGHFVGL